VTHWLQIRQKDHDDIRHAYGRGGRIQWHQPASSELHTGIPRRETYRRPTMFASGLALDFITGGVTAIIVALVLMYRAARRAVRGW